MPTQITSPLALVPSPGEMLEDPVPAEARAVLELFAAHLPKVQFPDVDAAALRKLADDVRAEAKAVARAREALTSAIAASDTRVAALSAACTRALAYAKVFAESPDRQPLAEALTALSQPAPVAPKRRGRPRKVTANPELFTGDIMSAGELNPPTR